jgi:hypothetical protein
MQLLHGRCFGKISIKFDLSLYKIHVLLDESKLKYAAEDPITKLIQISSAVSEMNYLVRGGMGRRSG